MELRSLAGASHPHVVAYRESYLADGAVTILMEHMDGGSLADVLSKVGRAAAAATARGWGRARRGRGRAVPVAVAVALRAARGRLWPRAACAVNALPQPSRRAAPRPGGAPPLRAGAQAA
jgi:hypothetical protein